ncbi:non-histone chromosomal protein 6 [Microbotryum lychnidis-dioicae p1A1 Lamole]|uniref:Non-histone chromosomal protein 6 n=2 Tax=Microbotryum TaxID=34416 RepID=U5HJI0_USTV1|nr:non-histone chromosomal protein 6 [Microbotryum lychnidis-dioicae p1A1 Lamole]SGY56171.1 BQ5605_C006g04112 [Microbotryum silenes-dioicae]|eukprot:KDE02271.1 non-histone chromosomal protein 6 [Microbotryum lychnidis-dioicae p1A1 Lamole]
MPKEVKSRATKVDTKSGKAKKDPNAPKRPLSAYMYFSQENRNTVKDDNPDASFGDLGKLLGAKWKDMSDEQKKSYIQKAEVDKNRYEREKASYDARA